MAPRAPRTYRVIVPEIPMARNKRERAHWALRRSEKQTWLEFIAYLGGRRIPTCRLGEHRTVQIHFDKGPRGKLDDDDNLPGRCKSILDCLTELGVLWDDDPKHCHLERTTQTARSDERRTIISITIGETQ